jgi:hypothetical protein
MPLRKVGCMQRDPYSPKCVELEFSEVHMQHLA